MLTILATAGLRSRYNHSMKIFMLLQLLTNRFHTLVVRRKRLIARQVRRLGRGMEPFRDNVFYLLWWRAILAALIGFVSMATCRGKVWR